MPSAHICYAHLAPQINFKNTITRDTFAANEVMELHSAVWEFQLRKFKTRYQIGSQ